MLPGMVASLGQSSTHVERLQTVPAKGVFTVLAHHLGASLIPLDVHLTLGTALDGGVVPLVLIEGAAGREENTDSVSQRIFKHLNTDGIQYPSTGP